MPTINERVVIKSVFHVSELMYCPLQDAGTELMNERSWLGFFCSFGIFFGFFGVFFRGKNERKGIKAEEFWDLGGSWVHSHTELLRAYSGNFLISSRMHIQHPFLSNLLFFPCCS